LKSDRNEDGRRELRRSLRAKRIALSAAERMAAAEAIATNLQPHPALARPGYVAGYWASGGELPLHVLQLRLRPDQIWCLPCVQPDGTLLFSPWRPGDPLVTNQYGIPEPNVATASLLEPPELHLVLLPLLGFDRSGNRLGMGAGYYDRSFAFRQGAAAPPTLIGVGYAMQEVPPIEAQAWDVPLDAIVTENEILEFGR
jgi:5-formyltetrahydrofolate cyclo-ligase